MCSQDTNIKKNPLDYLTEEERRIVYDVLGSDPKIKGTWLCHLNELNEEERSAYFDQLAKQPELKKRAAEYDKIPKSNINGYSVVDNGYKSSLEDSSIS